MVCLNKIWSVTAPFWGVVSHLSTLLSESLKFCSSCWLGTPGSGKVSEQYRNISINWEFKKTAMICWDLKLFYEIGSTFLKSYLELKCLTIARGNFLKNYSSASLPPPSLDQASLFCVPTTPYISFITAYPGLGQALQVEYGAPECQVCPWLLRLAALLSISRNTLTLDQMGTNLRVPEDSFRFNHSLERLIELTECSIINQPKEEMHREKSGKIPNVKLLLSSGMCNLAGTSTCEDRQSISNQRSSPKHQCWSFNWSLIA